MKVTYELTLKERLFLKALLTDTFRKNQWSGMSQDDAFIAKWRDEIRIFEAHKLTEKKDSGSYSEYWRYGLNAEGERIQDNILNNVSSKQESPTPA